MKSLLALATGLATVAPSLTVPSFAVAQSAGEYGSGDICRQQRRDAATKGGVAGAAAGAQIGRRSVKCSEYPRGITYHRANCRWVQEYYGGGYHDFEVCQDRDGVWRPSGRG